MERLKVIYGRVEYDGEEYVIGDIFNCDDVNRISELVKKKYCEVMPKEKTRQNAQPQSKNDNNKKQPKDSTEPGTDE